MNPFRSTLPFAIIGAGPVGLAAAAHLLARGHTPLVLEAAPHVGAHVRQWAHVRLFSPWREVLDPAARALLEAGGWTAPPADSLPTGGELVERYLEPLGRAPAIREHLRLSERVLTVGRAGFDRQRSVGREQAPFVVRTQTADGTERHHLARAVIDASGTFAQPNPAGAGGLPAIGEAEVAANVWYGIPDVLGAERLRFAGRRVLVLGSGHSAQNVLLDLAVLRRDAPVTRIGWAVRRSGEDARLFGGGAQDALAARGSLGTRVQEMVASGAVQAFTSFALDRLERTPEGIVASAGERRLPAADELVVATGFRPDFGPLRELRLALEPATESPVALGPLIDPNVHSCGTVPPHGAQELQHPERDFFVVGMKSYGRAPTFLLLTGYEQVRSVVAALCGDLQAAREVHLVLPETGVCGSATACALEAPVERGAIACCG